MSESNKKLDRFGRYLILDHLVDGGMAKICRARFLGEQADKVVAIKMVQAQFSKDESFKIMFMDEIKTTFGLLHPNIVQTYDYGIHNDQLYVAMEYCDGRNLKEYLDKLKERKFVFPVEISVFIAIQISQGLHYAHTLTDKLTGKPANIIHRDISPHNIMLTFDGSIKVIDFGIAKSSSNSESTQAGTIKGKLSYLAPEYLEGAELDCRYDLFAVGITLWELLCSRKLFRASNDLAVLKKIQECKIPKPSTINPNVPAELDEIVMKALHRDRNKRFSNMEDFARALNKFLYSTYPDFNSSDLSYFAKELFKDEIKLDREKMYEFGKINIKPYLEDLKNERAGIAPTRSSDDDEPEEKIATKSNKKRKVEENVLDFGFSEEDEEGNDDTVEDTEEKEVDPRRLSAPKKSSSGTSLKAKKIKSKNSVGDSTKVTKLNIFDKSKKIKIKRIRKNNEANKNYNNIAMIVGLALVLVIGVTASKSIISTTPKLTLVDKESIQDRTPSSEPMATLKLKNYNRRKYRTFINGVRRDPDILNKLILNPDESLVLRIEIPGRESFVINDLVLRDQEVRELDVEITGPAYFGYLSMTRSCFRGKIFFDMFGESREEDLPIKRKPGIPFPTSLDDDGLSIEREHVVYVQKRGQSVKKIVQFTIGESRVVDLCKILFR